MNTITANKRPRPTRLARMLLTLTQRRLRETTPPVLTLRFLPTV